MAYDIPCGNFTSIVWNVISPSYCRKFDGYGFVDGWHKITWSSASIHLLTSSTRSQCKLVSNWFGYMHVVKKFWLCKCAITLIIDYTVQGQSSIWITLMMNVYKNSLCAWSSWKVVISNGSTLAVDIMSSVLKSCRDSEWLPTDKSWSGSLMSLMVLGRSIHSCVVSFTTTFWAFLISITRFIHMCCGFKVFVTKIVVT